MGQYDIFSYLNNTIPLKVFVFQYENSTWCIAMDVT